MKLHISVLARLKAALRRAEYIGTMGIRSESDNGLYIRAVRNALISHRAFSSFKKQPQYRKILEHVSPESGASYLNLLIDEAPDLIDRIDELKVNDLIGGASRCRFPGVGLISPSTLRYIKVASDLRRFFGIAAGWRIAEIGVGYGGQLLVADRVLTFSEYHLFDLPPVLELASKYLECHLLRGTYQAKTLNQHEGVTDYDLVISNYAFSELPSKLQLAYLTKVISKAKRGYMTMNSGTSESLFSGDKLSLAQLKDHLPPFEVHPETPLTCPGNYLIVWGS